MRNHYDEAKQLHYQEHLNDARYDGPEACEGCTTFSCYDGFCEKYIEEMEAK